MPSVSVAAAGLGAVGSIGGALLGSGGASSAGNAQAGDSLAGVQFQQNVFDTTQKNLSPYMDVGKNALYSLASLYGLGGSPSSGGAATATGTGASSSTAAPTGPAASSTGNFQIPSGWMMQYQPPGSTDGNGEVLTPAQNILYDNNGNPVSSFPVGTTISGLNWTLANGQPQSAPAPAAAAPAASSNDPMLSPAMQAFKNFTQTPAYQFPLQQGQLAVNRSLAASGLANSGAALKDLTNYGQGYASQGFQGYINQLTGLANMGQNSAAGVGQQGNVAAGNVMSGLNTAGGAQAAGIVGSTNAITGGINNLTGLLTSPNAYSNLGGTGGGSVLSNLFSSGGGGGGAIDTGSWS